MTTTLTPDDLAFDIKPAIDNLTEHQRQLDSDGCEVGVSRQALDEVLAHHKAQAAEIERLTRERDEARHNIDGILMHLEAANAKVAALEKAMEEIRDHSANQDMNHKDFRVAAYHAADAALGAKP